MKLSIVITLYNRADKVSKAIESVLSQTYSNYEIIIVDDGSSDDPKCVLASYIDAQDIKYIRQDNMGPAGAKNRGAREASGDYIIFLDSDDWFENENVLEKISLSLSDDIGFLAFNQIRIIKDNKKFINSYKIKGDLVSEMMRYPLNYAACPPYVFRRELFLEVGGFNIEFKWGDAILFWRKYLPLSNNIILDGIGYVYDQSGEDSVSRKKDEKYLRNVFLTLECSYFELRDTLIYEKVNKEWELVLLGVALKMKNIESFSEYLLMLFSNNLSKIPSAIFYLMRKRISK